MRRRHASQLHDFFGQPAADLTLHQLEDYFTPLLEFERRHRPKDKTGPVTYRVGTRGGRVRRSPFERASHAAAAEKKG